MSIISKILEERKMKGKDPCWKGYQMVGMKDKNGRKVPNCVPEETELAQEEKETDEQDTADYKIGKDGRKVRAHKVVFNKGEEEMKEELKGDQHKIDLNKNGKVDGEDLANLRKKKSYKDFKEACGSMTSKKKIKEDSDEEFSEDILEELEQIAELSKSTLASYVKKATKSFGAKRSIATSFEKDADAALSTSKRETDTRIANDYIKDARKRLININKAADRLAKEEIELDEAVTVDKKTYHWGKMVTVHHGNKDSYPLHPEHQEAIKNLKDGDKTKFKDETKRIVTAHRVGNSVLLSHPQSGKTTSVAHSHFTEETHGKEVSLGLCEGMIERDDFDDRVAAYKKAGHKVLDYKHSDTKAHISFVDSEGTHRTVKYTPTGKTMQNHGAYEGGKKDTEGNKVNKTEVKTVKRGRGRPRKDKFAESVEILLSLTEEEFEEILADSTLDEIVESLCNLSDEELKELKG